MNKKLARSRTSTLSEGFCCCAKDTTSIFMASDHRIAANRFGNSSNQNLVPTAPTEHMQKDRQEPDTASSNIALNNLRSHNLRMTRAELLKFALSQALDRKSV